MAKSKNRPTYRERRKLHSESVKPIKKGVIDDYGCTVKGCEFSINVIAPSHWDKKGKYVKQRKIGTVSATPNNLAAIRKVKGY